MEWYDDKPMFKNLCERKAAEYLQIKNSLTGDEQLKIEVDLAFLKVEVDHEKS